MKRILLTLSLVISLATILAAAESIAPSATAPTIDGTVTTGEYTWTKTLDQVTVSASLGTDGLAYFAISAPTAGWVALGVGSDRMNNALIAMAYDDGKTPFFTEQKGAGHGHADAKDAIVKKWAVKNDKGVTTLEISVPAELATVKTQIKVIYAYGRDTNIKSYHAGRGSVTFDIKS